MASLTDRLADGENAAFVELFDLCGSRLLNFLQWKLLSHDDARDVLQEVFLALVRNRKRFRSVENPVAFAYQVARNESVRFIKHAIRSREKIQLAAAEIFIASDDYPNVAAETAEWITNALAQLEERQREVIVGSKLCCEKSLVVWPLGLRVTERTGSFSLRPRVYC